jgi:cell division protein FtsL
MSPLIERETTLYKQILTLLVDLAVVTVSGCLGLLWLRQKIEVTAQATRTLEVEIAKEERRLRYIDTKIAEIHQPLYLERQIKRLGLKLRPPMADQVVYMDGYPQYQRNRGDEENLYPQQREKDPFRYSIDLAVMKSLTPID